MMFLIFATCNSNNESKRKIELVEIKKDSSLKTNLNDYTENIGKVGYAEIVEINVDFNTSITHRQELINLGINLDKIEIPFHCSPILLSDTLALITSPRLYIKDMKTIVIIKYNGDIFNFSHGGDDVNVIFLKNNEKAEIHAALKKDKVIYEISNNPLSLMNNRIPRNESGQYILDYRNIIDDKLTVTEIHTLKFVKKQKYRISDIGKNCD